MGWVIVLLGAEVTAAFERRNQPFLADPWAMSERAVALAVVLRLGERMAGRRGTVTPATLAPELSIDEAVLVEVLRRLEQGRIVIETVAGDNGGEHGLFLARDSATIALSEVVECVRGSGPAPVSSDARVASMVEELRRAERETLGGFTVRDLIERAARVAAPGAERETGSGQAAAGQA
jgi:DNA-binding IscR family transcriptional regulator